MQLTDEQVHAIDCAASERDEWLKNDNESHLENGLDALREAFPSVLARQINQRLMSGYTSEDIKQSDWIFEA